MAVSITTTVRWPGVTARPCPVAARGAAGAAVPPRSCAGEQAPVVVSRRGALGGALLAVQLALLGRPSPAVARGLEAYIRTAKPQQPPEQIAAALLLAREELTQFEKVLASTAEFDAADLRALLRAGPFRKFRDSLRTLAKGLSDAQAGNADSEACFKQLEALDFVLIDLAKAEDKGPGRAEATARIGAAITSLDAVLAQLPQETMSAARAALQ